MKFRELLKKSGINVLDIGGTDDPAVTDVVYDSRHVVPGAVYVAIPGMTVHGDTFIAQAIESGAAAVVSENRQDGISVPWAAVSEIRTVAAKLGRALWNIDLSEVKTVGVTGTNGKTTTVRLFCNLFDRLIGKKFTWMFGTIGNRIGKNIVGSSHTTPESADIFRYIRDARSKPRAISMEVSSHSLALDRVAEMRYDVAVWTNLTQDHLDFHKSMDEYYEAKKSLFVNYMKPNGVCVINIDDEYGRRLYGELELAGRKLMTYGKSGDADVKIEDWKCDWDGTSLNVRVRHNGVVKTLPFTSRLCGSFNVYNLAAAIAGGFALDADLQILSKTLERTRTVPGRMDRVGINAPFAVVVDYAHTPDALVNVLKTAAELTEGRLICVFGCGGDRDKTKRPLMAKAVCENCGTAVVTSDNPRSEKPSAIIEDILKGVPSDFPHVVIEDRREAIRHAMRNARAGDCVIIAGKGHETYQEINGVRHHFDDKEEAVKIHWEMVNATRYEQEGHNKRAHTRLNLGALIEWGEGESKIAVTNRRIAVKAVCNDSRKLNEPVILQESGKVKAGDVFAALRSDTDDGHRYAESAFKQGAIAAIVDRRELGRVPEKMRRKCIVVPDTVKAVQMMAKRYREEMGLLVIGITGSNGKTTTRSFISEALRTAVKVGETYTNWNNHIGVPQSILRFDGDEWAGVLEMGANHVGEISSLTKICKPDIAVITNIGYAHVGLFGGLEKTTEAKFEIAEGLSEDGFMLLNGDDPRLVSGAKERGLKTVFFGTSDICGVRAADISVSEKGVAFTVDGSKYSMTMPGRHFIYCALPAIFIARRCGIPEDAIQNAIASLKPVSLRGMVEEKNGVRFIVDCYNANPSSMSSAVTYLADLTPDKEKRVAVVGDMYELEEYTNDLHLKLGEELVKSDVRKIVAAGKFADLVKEGAEKAGMSAKNIYTAKDAEEALGVCRDVLKSGETVLLKGSRGVGLEKVFMGY